MIVSFYKQLSPKPAAESLIDGLLVSCLDWEKKESKRKKEALKYSCAYELNILVLYMNSVETGDRISFVHVKPDILPMRQVHSPHYQTDSRLRDTYNF